jgi:uncharacterized phage protein (TIGR02220 family)
MRTSFLLHIDSLSILDKMSNEQAGILIKAMYFYQINGNLPDLDFAIDMAITPFINQFKRDSEKYIQVIEKRRKAGAKGGKQKVANASKSKEKVANLADSVNDNVSVNNTIVNYDRVFDSFKKITGKSIKLFGNKEKSQLSARLKDGFTYEDIELAIKNCYNDSYHKETNHKYLTLEFILRQDKLSKFSTIEESIELFGLELSQKITWTNPENITQAQYDSLPPQSKQNYSQLILQGRCKIL